jgi:cell division protein FtsZ
MVLKGLKHVEFICANTDVKALKRNNAHYLLQLGNNLTKGLGAGSIPEIGRNSAIEDRNKIKELLKDTDMIFIATGMGGGTGTGAAPVIAEIAKELKILTVGVVTKPFEYEGKKRTIVAEQGILEMEKYVDSLIIIPNEKLMTELDQEISMREAFTAVDNVLFGAISGITEVIKTPGIISVDFADVRTVMTGKGLAMMGSGSAKGENRARNATEMAIYSPLLDNVALDGAKGVLVNISSAIGTLKMKEYHEIIRLVQERLSPDVDFKAGMAEIEDMPEDELRVTIIATGLTNIDQEKIMEISLVKNDAVSINNDKNIDLNEKNFNTNNIEKLDLFNNFDKTLFSKPAFFRRK